MEQLKMYWKNDGTAVDMPRLPEGMDIVTYSELPNAEAEWVDIIKYGSMLPEVLDPEVNYYLDCMKGLPYSDDLCFFIRVGGVPAATITAICNKETREGLVHMVGAKPEFRGLGLGNLMCDLVLWVFKREGMETARLKTDDWRVPAIKTYLRMGFVPDLDSEPDYRERWEKILGEIGK